MIAIFHFSQICKRLKEQGGVGEAREGGPLEPDRLFQWLLPWFFVVGTNCRPVAESLSCCLLKISGKARGGERKRETDRHREGALLKFFFFFLTAGHPAEKHSLPQSLIRPSLPSMQGSRQIMLPSLNSSPSLSPRVYVTHTPPCLLSKLCWLCTGCFDIV